MSARVPQRSVSYSRNKLPLATYERLHRAMLDTVHELGIALADVKLLLALAERGGEANTLQLELDLLGEPAAIRRSLLTCRPRFCVGGDKRGSRLPIELTDEGWEVAEAVAQRFQPTEGRCP